MKNLSLKTKLFTLAGFLLAISITLGGVGYWAVTSVGNSYSIILKHNLPNLAAVNDMYLTVRLLRIDALHLAMHGTSAEDNDRSIASIEASVKQLALLNEKYIEQPFSPGEEEAYKPFWESVTQLKADVLKVVDMYKDSDGDDSPGRLQMRAFLIGELRTNAYEVATHAATIRKYHSTRVEFREKEANAAFSLGTMLSLLVLCAGTLSGAAFAYIFSNSLVKTLRQITASIADSSHQVSSAAGQIASSSQELSQAATEQAASLEETAASIEELNSMVNKNRDNAKSTAGVSNESESTASRGRSAVEQMIVSMNEINQSNEQITEIVKVINEIGNKTKVINDIVFQTKLLSFNASVEAARAGEHGKGFAVVAEEVGNLAQMSGNAAKEISALLESSVHKVETIVNETKAKVESGTLTAQQCGQILTEIVTNVSRVASMAGEISTASEEQSRGVQEITRAMTQLDQVTQTNAATSEETASAAEELSAQSDALKSLVLDLTMTVNGRSGAGDSAAPPAAPAAHADGHNGKAPKGKLLHMKSKTPSAPALSFKKASGDNAIPQYDDTRFQDV